MPVPFYESLDDNIPAALRDDYWRPAVEATPGHPPFLPSLESREVVAVRNFFNELVPRILGGQILTKTIDSGPFDVHSLDSGTLVYYDVERMYERPELAEIPDELLTQTLVNSSLKEPYDPSLPGHVPYIESDNILFTRGQPPYDQLFRRMYKRTSWFTLFATLDKKVRQVTMPVAGFGKDQTTRMGRRPLNGAFLAHPSLLVGQTVVSGANRRNLTAYERLNAVKVVESGPAVWEVMVRQSELPRRIGRFVRKLDSK